MYRLINNYYYSLTYFIVVEILRRNTYCNNNWYYSSDSQLILTILSTILKSKINRQIHVYILERCVQCFNFFSTLLIYMHRLKA